MVTLPEMLLGFSEGKRLNREVLIAGREADETLEWWLSQVWSGL
jgi:hypothetical protein